MEGMSRSCPGSSDPTPPVASTWVAAPHRSWFGRTRTATWGDGGVCFLDPLPWPSREGTLPTAPNAHADSASDDAIDANSTSSNDTSTNGTSASGIDRIRDSGTVDNSANVGESETQHHTLLRLHKIRQVPLGNRVRPPLWRQSLLLGLLGPRTPGQPRMELTAGSLVLGLRGVPFTKARFRSPSECFAPSTSSLSATPILSFPLWFFFFLCQAPAVQRRGGPGEHDALLAAASASAPIRALSLPKQ